MFLRESNQQTESQGYQLELACSNQRCFPRWHISPSPATNLESPWKGKWEFENATRGVAVFSKNMFENTGKNRTSCLHHWEYCKTNTNTHINNHLASSVQLDIFLAFSIFLKTMDFKAGKNASKKNSNYYPPLISDLIPQISAKSKAWIVKPVLHGRLLRVP